MKIWGASMALMLGGCILHAAPAAEHRKTGTSENHESEAARSAPAGSAQPEPAPPADIVVEVEKGRITIDGVEVEPKALALQQILMNRSTLKTKLVVRSEATDADRTALVIAVREAAQTIAREIELSLGKLRLTVHSPFEEQRREKRTWMVHAEAKELSLWLGKDRLQIGVGDAAAETRARELVERECARQACWADLTLSHDTPLIPTLLAWQRVFGDRGTTLLVSLPNPDGPRAPNGTAAAVATVASKGAAGRLPPEVIQRIVRQNFESFRHCYEQGLGRNPNLAGKMIVRFVIGLDGKVTSAQDFGSNMPDLQVRECVVQSFRELAFPNPEAGAVTVVYPIILAPS
jgi:hypothetical protein